MFLRRIKKRNLQKFQSQEIKSLKNQTTKVKNQKVDSSIDETKINLKLTSLPYTNKQDYVGGTNDKTRDSQTRNSEDFLSDTDGCARNLDGKHKNEEDEDYIDLPFKKKDIIESKLQGKVRNRLLSKNISFKVIKAVMFNIDNHEKEILAVCCQNKKNQTQDKCNQLNLM